jgi:hypothetical protein
MTKQLRIIPGAGMLFLIASLPGTARCDEGSTVSIALERNCRWMWEIQQAQRIADQIFARIGLRIQWLDYRRAHTPAFPPDAIVVSLSAPPPKNLRSDALALALPFEGTHVQLFYERIQATVSRDRVPILAAHVLAHEVTHILQGTDSHSPTGIMKAHWDSHDYLEMESQRLSFEPYDVMLIRNGLGWRSGQIASSR